MRIELKLKIQPCSQRYLPLNYQYELSAAIYKIIAYANPQHAEWLHNEGFMYENKQYKMFCFSNLIIPQKTKVNEKPYLYIDSDNVFLYVSFLHKETTLAFLKGIHRNNTIPISDGINTINFIVTDALLMNPITRYENYTFSTLSPVCVTLRDEQKKTLYLDPNNPLYEKALLRSVLSKYRVYYGEDYKGEIYCKFHLQGVAKPKLVTIKANTNQETKVKGYHFKFNLKLPTDLLNLAYESGLGEKNGIGFGMINLVQ